VDKEKRAESPEPPSKKDKYGINEVDFDEIEQN
jgi:hypothetical protein